MALEIFTEAKPFLNANIKPFDIMEIEMLTFCVCDLNFLRINAINFGRVMS